MENTIFSQENQKGRKSILLDKVVSDLMANCDSILAVIIADWQGFSFASKLPKDVNKYEISATTLFTLESAEGTRKELEKTLLGNKLSYLIMVTGQDNKLAYMFIFPIEKLGYIASISHVREDTDLIVHNMKIAAKKAAQILTISSKIKEKKALESFIAPKYESLLQKLEDLKNIKLSFLEPALSSTNASIPSKTTMKEAPSVSGPLSPPEIPLEFIEVETETPLEPEIIIPPQNLTKFQVIFLDSKNIKYTVNIEASNEFDVEVRLREMEQYHPINIIKINKLD